MDDEFNENIISDAEKVDGPEPASKIPESATPDVGETASESSVELNLSDQTESNFLDETLTELKEPVHSKKKSHKKLVISLIAIWVVIAIVASGFTYLYLFYISPAMVAKDAFLNFNTGKVTEYINCFPPELRDGFKNVDAATIKTFRESITKQNQAAVGDDAKLSVKILDVSYFTDSSLNALKSQNPALNKKDINAVNVILKTSLSGIKDGKHEEIINAIKVVSVKINGKWYYIGSTEQAQQN